MLKVLFDLYLDGVDITSLYVHHQYIGGLTTLGALVHLTLHLLNESSSFKHLIFDNLMPTKRIVVSILSWITLFLTSGNYLLGWFRDYLWANCGPLIYGYTALQSNRRLRWVSCCLDEELQYAKKCRGQQPLQRFN